MAHRIPFTAGRNRNTEAEWVEIERGAFKNLLFKNTDSESCYVYFFAVLPGDHSVYVFVLYLCTVLVGSRA